MGLLDRCLDGVGHEPVLESAEPPDHGTDVTGRGLLGCPDSRVQVLPVEPVEGEPQDGAEVSTSVDRPIDAALDPAQGDEALQVPVLLRRLDGTGQHTGEVLAEQRQLLADHGAGLARRELPEGLDGQLRILGDLRPIGEVVAEGQGADGLGVVGEGHGVYLLNRAVLG